MEAPPKGPYVQAALFCERVLVEKDNVTSIVRVIDQVTHTAAGPEPPEELPPFNYELQMLVMLKPGGATGRSTFTIVMEGPDGLKRELGSGTVNFVGGPNQGANLHIRLSPTFEQDGLYWFDVLLDNALMTRIPLAVLYQRIKSGKAQ